MNWPALRTHAEFMRSFNCFRNWGVVHSLVYENGAREYYAEPPWRWPQNWWWECDCYNGEPPPTADLSP